MDIHDVTALHMANMDGKTDIAKMLLNAGANFEAMVNYTGIGDMTPLLIASIDGKADCVEIFAKAGACIEASDQMKAKPLHKASSRSTQCTTCDGVTYAGAAGALSCEECESGSTLLLLPSPAWSAR